MAVRVVSSDSPPPSPPRSGSYGSGLMQPDMKQAFGLRRRFGGDEPRAMPWAGIKQAFGLPRRGDNQAGPTADKPEDRQGRSSRGEHRWPSSHDGARS